MDKVHTYWNALLQTIIIPDRAERHSLEFLLQCQTAGEIAFDLILSKSILRLEQCDQQRPQRVARTDSPGRDAVDAGIEIIQPDVDALQGVTADDLIRDRLCVIVERNHMITVPAYAA